MKQFDVKFVTILILIIAILGGSIYHIIKTNNIKDEVVTYQINRINDISPLIRDEKSNVIVTLEKIKETEENINILKKEMKTLKIDTIQLDEAINLIKDKKNEMDSDMFINTPGLKF